MQHKACLSLILMLFSILMAGCRESAQPTQPSSDGASNAAANISVEFTQQPARVGEDLLYIRVMDGAGSTLPVADLSVRGDMSHAGMEPEITSYEAPEANEEGIYIIPFNWSMGGEWVLTVEARLQDDAIISEQIDLVVEG